MQLLLFSVFRRVQIGLVLFSWRWRPYLFNTSITNLQFIHIIVQILFVAQRVSRRGSGDQLFVRQFVRVSLSQSI